ncbi:hypothetical protein BH20CHL6_BH20CHL6_13170 [soil metagenome]
MASYAVEFDMRTVFDFLISLTIGDGSDRDLLPEDQRWLQAARSGLPAQLRSELDSCFGESSKGVFHGVGSLAVALPEVRDAADFLRTIENLSTAEIARVTIAAGVQDETLGSVIERAVEGDRAAIEELAPRLSDYSREDVLAFLRDPEPAVQRALAVMHAWLEPFGQVEERVLAMLARDVADRAADRATLDQATLIERTTGGMRWLPEPQARRVVLAPSYFARPYNHVYAGADWRLFCYPVADSALGADDGVTPPPAMVRLHRALGDPTRLRILKLLRDRDWYLTELAQQLELSKPTIKHHLAQLRAAGLATVTEEGTLHYYSLRRERLEEAGTDLLRYLG